MAATLISTSLKRTAALQVGIRRAIEPPAVNFTKNIKE